MNRAIRRHHEKRVIANRLRLIKMIEPAANWLDFSHRLYKTKPYDCGNARCCLCHPYKYYNKTEKKKYEYIEDYSITTGKTNEIL